MASRAKVHVSLEFTPGRDEPVLTGFAAQPQPSRTASSSFTYSPIVRPIRFAWTVADSPAGSLKAETTSRASEKSSSLANQLVVTTTRMPAATADRRPFRESSILINGGLLFVPGRDQSFADFRAFRDGSGDGHLSPKAGFRWSKQRESNFTGIQNPVPERASYHLRQLKYFGDLLIGKPCVSRRPERAARTIAWPVRPDCSPVGHRVGPPEFFVVERLLEEEELNSGRRRGAAPVGSCTWPDEARAIFRVNLADTRQGYGKGGCDAGG